MKPQSFISRRQVIGKVVDFAKKRDAFSSYKAEPRFLFYQDKKTGKLLYRKIYILDTRWLKREWQGRAKKKIVIADTVKNIFIIVILISRRQGKTWLLINEAVESLCRRDVPDPRGKYFCEEKEQAVRNAELAMENAIMYIPGAWFDADTGILTIPHPTLKNPNRTIKFRMFGQRGGEKVKRGDHAEMTIFDEVDGFTEKFINNVGVASAIDYDGTLILSGTDTGEGVLRGYINRAKNMCSIRARIAEGTFRGDPPPSVNNWEYIEEDVWQTGVFDKEKMKVVEDVMGKVDFAREFGNIDYDFYRKFYYRELMDTPNFRENRLVYFEPEDRLPVWIYYDLGIGDKSDRMAIAMVQHVLNKMQVLWATDWVNGSLEQVVIALREQNPFKQLVIQEHVLPHDGKNRDEDLQTPRNKLERWLTKYFVGGVVRVRPRTTSLKIEVDTVREVLRSTIFHEQYASSMWDALYCHKKKEVAPGVFSEDSAKTKYRDLADTFRHACADHQDEEYKYAINEVPYQTPRVPREKISEAPPVMHEHLVEMMQGQMGELRSDPDCFRLGV